MKRALAIGIAAALLCVPSTSPAKKSKPGKKASKQAHCTKHKTWFIDKSGKTVLEPKQKGVYSFKDGMARFMAGDRGSGIAIARAAQQQANIDAMSPEDRRASGIHDLRQARNLLSSVLAGLDAAAPGAFSVENARTEIVQAEHCLRLAAMKLGDQAIALLQEPDDTEQLAVATASDALGGVAARMASAAQSSGMRKKARSLLGMAEEALKRHQAVS